MLARARVFWAEARDSLWLMPAAMTLAAIALALITVQIDEQVLAGRQSDLPWVFGGGAEGARGVLSAIASGIITVGGVVFSITIVALQLASSQYSPRVLRNFTADRVNQAVLGIFIGTFTYTLLVLRAVRSATADASAFVPALSVTVAIALALVSIGFLIAFIGHTARSIRAATIVDRAARDALHHVDDLFPEMIGRPAEMARSEPNLPAMPPAIVAAAEGGYLQSVDEDVLLSLAEKARLTVRMEPFLGDFVLPGATLASVWPRDAVDGDVTADVRRTFVLGQERLPDQDVELGLRQLADIAVKALSPGINDPTTAKSCVDRLAEVLVVLGNREMPPWARTDQSGRLLFLARRTTFDRAVALAFDDIRHFGAGTPSVAAHLLCALDRIARLVPPPRRGPLLNQAVSTLAIARREIHFPGDLAVVEQAGRWVVASPHPHSSEASQEAV